jgi:hypothetical protein
VTWKRLWLEKIIPVGQAGRVMADYRVIFFNNLVNSYGKSFKCLQRAITVSSAKDAGEALEKAKREFERLEGVPNMDGFGRTLGKLVNQRYMLLVMCGRSTYKLTWEEIVALYRLTLDQPARNTQARYNVCPTTTIDTVVGQIGGHALVPMRWGLVPSWWSKPLKDLKLATVQCPRRERCSTSGKGQKQT